MRRVLLALLLVAAVLVVPSAAAARPALADRTILLVGDSITASIAVQPGDKLDVRLGYRLCGIYCGQPGYPTVVNRGVSGTRLLGGVNPLHDTFAGLIASLHAGDVVHILIGANDLPAYEGDAAWTQAYVDIVHEALAAGLIVWVGQITPISSARWSWELLRERLDGWLLSYFGAPMVIPYSDVLHCTTGSCAGSGWLDPTYDCGDGLHLDALGYVRMADAIAAKATI